MVIVCILSISAISATENTANKEVTNTEINQETNIQYDDVSTSNMNDELNLEENNGRDIESRFRIDKTTTINEDPLTFTDLNTTINGNNNSTIYLSNNYKYNSASDGKFKNGIPISRNLTIYGNGVTLDGSNMARIFNVTNTTFNVKFYDIHFINGNSKYGGAIYRGNAYNCTFTKNSAHGGAIYSGNAYNCTFNENTADYGGAIYYGNAYNCTFNENTALVDGGAIHQGNAINCTFNENTALGDGGAIWIGEASYCTFNNNKANWGGAIYSGNAYNCNFTKNKADKHGGAIYFGNATNCTFTNNTADYGGAISSGNATNCTFTGNYASITGGAIYVLQDVFANVYNCTFNENTASEGGAISSGNAYNCTFTHNIATLYGGAISSGNAYNCTFTGNNAKWGGGAIDKGNAINCTLIKNNATLGIAIFNGNATNSTFICYNAPKNEIVCNGSTKDCIFIYIKTTVIVIDPIINAEVGKETKITYYTNSNGTATIKVNGQPITDNKFTPTTAGTYNVIVEVAENDYYTAGSNETTFTAEKTNTTVSITPISDVKVGEEVTINYTTNSNGTVTIKVNGQPIAGNTFTPTTAGTYNVIVEVAENDYYTAGSNETTFNVEKLATQITASPVTTTYNVGKNLVITVKDENGKPINDAVLTVNLGSTKKYTTDANGQVKINVATLTPKTYTAKITYAGSDSYNGTTGSTKVTVKKATPKITAKATSYKLKVKTKQYTATFKDNKNQALKNTKVTLKVNGKTYSVKTNNKGQGVFKITNLKKIGSYSAVITVPANTYYNKVTKNVKITVKQ